MIGVWRGDALLGVLQPKACGEREWWGAKEHSLVSHLKCWAIRSKEMDCLSNAVGRLSHAQAFYLRASLNQWSDVPGTKLSFTNKILIFFSSVVFPYHYIFRSHLRLFRASLVVQMVKNLPVMPETPVWSQSQKDPLEKGNGYPLQYSCLENSMDRGAWGHSPWGRKESDMTDWLTLSLGLPRWR